MTDGYVKLWRETMDSNLWQLPPTHFRVAIYLLLRARSSEKPHILNDGTKVLRGELVTSMLLIAENCVFHENRMEREMSRKKVLNILVELEKIGFISRNSHRKGTHITICNYDSYQQSGNDNSHAKETQVKHTLPTNKNVKSSLCGSQIKEIAEHYNAVRGAMPKCLRVTEKRRGQISKRLEEVGLEELKRIITECAGYDLFIGKNDRGWTADLEWITQATNFTKIQEGKYRNKKKPQSEFRGF